jgi:peptidoglycan hydrolase-like protein with peptidoglycan-binding domain
MRSILGPSLACLAVLYALSVLLSEYRGIPSGFSELPSGSRLITNTERTADVGDRLIQVIVLRRQRQSNPASPNTDRIMKVQQALKDDGFHSGSVVDSTIRQSTRETIRSFKGSNQLIMTGTVDVYTGRELGIHIKADGP